MRHKNLDGVLGEAPVVFFEQHPTFGGHVYATPTDELYTGTTTISGAWRKDFLAPWHALEAVKELGYFDPKYDKELKGLKGDALTKKLAEKWDWVLKVKQGMETLTPQQYVKLLEHAKGAAKRLSEAAKDDGHEAHSWIESFICTFLDGSLKAKPEPTKTEAKNAVSAFLKWHEREKDSIEWLASEETVGSKVHRVAGTLDALLNYRSLLTIGDIKTSNQLSEDYLLQLAGYDIQLAEMGLQARQWLIIRTPRDGSEVETLTVNDPKLMQFARESFLHQRESHRFYVYAESKLKSGDGFARKMKVDTDTKVGPEQTNESKK